MVHRNNEEKKEQVIKEINRYLKTLQKGDKIDTTNFIVGKYYSNILSSRLLSVIDAVVNAMVEFSGDFDEAKASVLKIFNKVFKVVPVYSDTDKLVYQFYQFIIEQIIISVRYLSIYPAKQEVLKLLQESLNLFNLLLSSPHLSWNKNFKRKELLDKIKTFLVENAYLDKIKAFEKDNLEVHDSVIQSVKALEALQAMIQEDNYESLILNAIVSLSANNKLDFPYWSYWLRNQILYNSIFEIRKQYELSTSDLGKSERLKNLFMLQR